MQTESRPDTLPIHSTPPREDTLLSPWQIKSLDCSTINKYLIKALCHGLSPSETIYGRIDTGKAAKMSRNPVCCFSFYWFSARLQQKSERLSLKEGSINSPSCKLCEDLVKALEMLSTFRFRLSQQNCVLFAPTST